MSAKKKKKTILNSCCNLTTMLWELHQCEEVKTLKEMPHPKCIQKVVWMIMGILYQGQELCPKCQETINTDWLDKKIAELGCYKKENIPPRIYQCFQCQGEIIIKWVMSSRGWSRKNCWNYWTDSDKEADRQKHICNTCLKKLYYDKITYWKAVKNPKKRKLLTVYIYEKKI